MLSAGQVEVCPCLIMTIPDKLHITQTIKLAVERGNSTATRQYFYNGLFYRPAASAKPDRSRLRRPAMVHFCSFRGHPSANLEISLKCAWDEPCQVLGIGRHYTFIGKSISKTNGARKHHSKPDGKSSFDEVSPETPFTCPHQDPEGWILQFFQEAGATFAGVKKEDCIEIVGDCSCPALGQGFNPFHNLCIVMKSYLSVAGGRLMYYRFEK